MFLIKTTITCHPKCISYQPTKCMQRQNTSKDEITYCYCVSKSNWHLYVDNCKFKFRTRFIMTRIKLSMHDSNILHSMYIINMISENMIMKQIWSQNTYCAGAAGKTKGADETKTVLRTERSNRRCRRRYAAAPDLDGGRAVAKKMSSRA